MDNYDGYYVADYYSYYNGGIIIVRFNPATSSYAWDSNEWGKSADLPVPSGNTLYELSGFNDAGYSYPVGGTWVMAGNRHIAADYKSWKSSSESNSGNTMTLSSGFSYTKTINDKPLKAGTYGFKFVNGSTWVGDPNNSGSNFTVEIANDGVYDITYSFDELTHAASAAAELDGSSVPVDYKYYIFDYDSKGQTYEDITEQGWWLNEMTESDGKFYLTLNDVNLTNTTYGFRLVEKVFKNGVEQADSNGDWAWNYIGNEYGGNNGCRTITIGTAGKYDVTFSYDPVSANYDNTSSTPSINVNNGYYMIRCANGGSWKVDSRLERNNNTWTGTVSDTHSGYFAIVDATDLDSDPVGDDYTSWSNSKVVRPKVKEKYNVGFYHLEGETAFKSDDSGYDFVWEPTASNDADITINYTPSTSSWTIDCARTTSIGTAGYITYSNGEKCKVSGAEAIYVITQDNGNGTVHGKEMDANTVWPADEGMILKGKNEDVITISAVASDETASTIGTNYLVGSGNSTASITAREGVYIFSMQNGNLGFYKALPGTLDAHKAYLNLGSSSAREFLGFDFDEGEATGISAAKTEIGQDDQVVYDLQGRKINGQCSKGLYIVNGKKVIIK